MLYGMADPIKDALVDLGQRVRVYTPYGQLLPGMAYLVRRLLENTSNESFLRASFTEHVPEEKLLMNPLRTCARCVRATTASARRSACAARRTRRLQQRAADRFQPEANRQAMQAGARRGRAASSAGTYPLVIDGHDGRRRRQTIDSVNPSHNAQVVGRVRPGDAGAADAGDRGRARGLSRLARHRAAASAPSFCCERAEIMRRRRFELAAWEVYECGKHWREADADVAEAIDFCEYYGREMLRLAEPQHARRARRGERLLLRAARRGRRHRAVELSRWPSSAA